MSSFFNVSGSVHPRNILVYIQQQFILSGSYSTCFGWYLHLSSGAQTTASCWIYTRVRSWYLKYWWKWQFIIVVLLALKMCSQFHKDESNRSLRNVCRHYQSARCHSSQDRQTDEYDFEVWRYQ